MPTTTRLGKRTAIVIMAAAIALCATGCLPSAAPSSAGGPGDPYLSDLFNAMNQDRANAGLPPLADNSQLDGLAGSWSSQMASDNLLHHQDLASILYSPGYQDFHTLGENIIVAPGSYSAQELESAWMNSPPHRANILNGGFNSVGLGVFRGPDGRLWSTADYGG
jgi:uncharacterized protein YkwD